MTVSLTRVNTVANGRFNPHIFDPQWLFKQGILDKASDRKFEFGFQPLSTEIRIQSADYTLLASQVRLVVESDSLRDCGHIVAGILEKLPHTPLVAVGNNFTFHCENLEKWGNRPIPRLGDISRSQMSNDPGMTRWECMWQEAETRITVKLEDDKISGLTIALNFHRMTEDSDKGRSAADSLFADFSRGKEIMERLFLVKEITNAKR